MSPLRHHSAAKHTSAVTVLRVPFSRDTTGVTSLGLNCVLSE